MCGDAESNRRAAENGALGEDIAASIIMDCAKNTCVARLNDIIDFLVGRCYIEVKTCQCRIIDRSRGSGYRAGRFILDINQHESLVKRQGLYMFIVLDDGELMKFRLMRACDIDFTNNLTWTKIIHHPGNTCIEEVYKR